MFTSAIVFKSSLLDVDSRMFGSLSWLCVRLSANFLCKAAFLLLVTEVVDVLVAEILAKKKKSKISKNFKVTKIDKLCWGLIFLNYELFIFNLVVNKSNRKYLIFFFYDFSTAWVKKENCLFILIYIKWSVQNIYNY